jgi:hypothetical protein
MSTGADTKQSLVLRAFGLLFCLSLSGCALAELAELDAAGAEAAAIGGETLAAGETAALARAAMTGDAAALTRLGSVEGAAIAQSEVAALSRVASLRAVGTLGVSSPLVEEIAVIRAGGRVLAYPESYPVARLRNLTVRMPSGSVVASIRRLDTTAVVKNAQGTIVGESVSTGGRFNHYTDSSRSTLRGYSTFDGTKLQHWIFDDRGNATYLGAEIVRPRAGTPPDTLTVSSALLGGGRKADGPEGTPGASEPRGVDELSKSVTAAARYFLQTLADGDITEAYNCMSPKPGTFWHWKGGIVYDVLTHAAAPSSLADFRLTNKTDENEFSSSNYYRITAVIEGENRSRIRISVRQLNGLWRIEDFQDVTGQYRSVYRDGKWRNEEL